MLQAAGQSTQGPLQPAPGLPRGLGGPQPLALPASHYLPAPPDPLSDLQESDVSVGLCQGQRDSRLPNCGGQSTPPNAVYKIHVCKHKTSLN